jgi:hypothetical protein
VRPGCHGTFGLLKKKTGGTWARRFASWPNSRRESATVHWRAQRLARFPTVRLYRELRTMLPQSERAMISFMISLVPP